MLGRAIASEDPRTFTGLADKATPVSHFSMGS
jgi:hypothetical protein